MNSYILILSVILFQFFETLQSKEKSNSFSTICSSHVYIEEDDFGRGTLMKTKPIRVADGFWISSSSVGDEKKLYVSLVFTGTSNHQINPTEVHEFSFDSSAGKIIVQMTPSEIKSPVSKTQVTGGSEYIPLSTSNTTTYTLIYDLNEESFLYFKTNLLSSIRINSLSSVFPFKATRITKLNLFRNAMACLEQ